MRIAYLHYHLKTGGVTTVIKQQLSALAGETEQMVLTGLLPDAPLNAHAVHIMFTTRRWLKIGTC